MTKEVATYSENGAHIEVLVASAKAIVSAVNKMAHQSKPEHQRGVDMPSATAGIVQPKQWTASDEQPA